MKAVIKCNSRNEIKDIVDSLLDVGYDEFIIFTSLEEKEKTILENMFLLWDIRAVVIKIGASYSTYDLLKSIKGSLSETFLLAYSSEIGVFDIEDALLYHKSSTNITTLLSTEKRTVGIILEIEVFDYMMEPIHFEKGIIKRIFEDGEASIYNLASYEIY